MTLSRQSRTERRKAVELGENRKRLPCRVFGDQEPDKRGGDRKMLRKIGQSFSEFMETMNSQIQETQLATRVNIHTQVIKTYQNPSAKIQ